MSFLLTRSQSRVRAGWYDTFENPGPLKQPWVHLGDNFSAFFNSVGELQIPSNATTVDGGGESYEFMPFTPNSGLEMEIWNPVTGTAVTQSFSVYMTDTWAKIGGAFTDVVGVRLLRPLVGGEKVQVGQWNNVYSFDSVRGEWSPPVAFNGAYIQLKIWVDDDQYVRVWMNGTYLGGAMVSPSFKLGPGRRAVRFLNTNNNTVYIRYVYHFDREPTFPPASVFSNTVLTDDFNRANGAVGNGWTQIGTNAAIASNSWSTINTTDGSRGLIRDSGITNGRQRIEGVVGGNIGISSSSASSLYLCSNSAGTSALAANIFDSEVYISQLSTSMTAPTMSDFTSSTGLTISNGDTIAFTVHDGNAWIERNGTRIAYAVNVNASVSASNPYMGLGVRRTSGVNSGSWNATTLKAAG